jgi:hypothetical protein
MDRGDSLGTDADEATTMTSSVIEVLPIAVEGGRESQTGPESAHSGMLDENEIEAGALLILACVVGCSFARMWTPGMNDIPHSGSLPREEYLLERNLPLEVDGTFSLNGRPWLMLK